MRRFARVIGLTALAVAVGVGCGKKPDAEPDTNGEPEAKAAPQPAPAKKAKPGPRPKKEPTPDQGETIFGAHSDISDKSQLIKQYFGFQVYLDTYKQFPSGIVGPNGDLGLSWRVAILPYMGDEHAALFKEFKLAEAWDSPHNKKLLTRMPEEFATPGTAAAKGKTYFRVFAGPKAFVPLPEKKPANMRDHWGGEPGQLARGRTRESITDGENNTLMVVMANEPVEWTKPEYLTYTDDSFPALGLHKRGFMGIRVNGSTDYFRETVSEKSLRALVSVNAGDEIGSDVHIFGLTRPKK